MALVSALVAGAAATIPVATLGVLNFFSGKRESSTQPQPHTRAQKPTQPCPQRTQLMAQTPSVNPTSRSLDTHAPAHSAPAKLGQADTLQVAESYSVLDDPELFPTANNSDLTADDLFRDPYTQQLYLCTEDEMPLPDTDVSLHPSSEDSQRKRAWMNGLIGNEHIRRKPESTDHKNSWSGDPSAAILRTTNPAREASLNHAFTRVSHFKHDDARPAGTGLIPRGEQFGGNKIGYNWDDVWSLRRNIVNRFNVRREGPSMHPVTHLAHTTETQKRHPGNRPVNMDVGQLRKRRGSLDNVNIANRSNSIPSRQVLLEKSNHPTTSLRRRDATRALARQQNMGNATHAKHANREATRVALKNRDTTRRRRKNLPTNTQTGRAIRSSGVATHRNRDMSRNIANRPNAEPLRLRRSNRSGGVATHRTRDTSRDIGGRRNREPLRLRRSNRENTRIAVHPNKSTTRDISKIDNRQSNIRYQRSTRERSVLVARNRNLERRQRAAKPKAKQHGNRTRAEQTHILRADGMRVGTRNRGTATRVRNSRRGVVDAKLRDDAGKGTIVDPHKRKFFKNANLPTGRTQQTSGFRLRGGVGHQAVRPETVHGARAGGMGKRSSMMLRNRNERAFNRENRGSGTAHNQTAIQPQLRGPKINHEARGRVTGVNRNGQQRALRPRNVTSSKRSGIAHRQRTQRDTMFAGHSATRHARVRKGRGSEVAGRPGNGLSRSGVAETRPKGRQNFRRKVNVRRASAPKALPVIGKRRPTARLARGPKTNEVQHANRRHTFQPASAAHGRLEFDD